jgi:hypothetical protein
MPERCEEVVKLIGGLAEHPVEPRTIGWSREVEGMVVRGDPSELRDSRTSQTIEGGNDPMGPAADDAASAKGACYLPEPQPPTIGLALRDLLGEPLPDDVEFFPRAPLRSRLCGHFRQASERLPDGLSPLKENV